jgi:hypothetical protein
VPAGYTTYEEEITLNFTFPRGKFVSDTPFHPLLHPTHPFKKVGITILPLVSSWVLLTGIDVGKELCCVGPIVNFVIQLSRGKIQFSRVILYEIAFQKFLKRNYIVCISFCLKVILASNINY